jgi:hypothetical protein
MEKEKQKPYISLTDIPKILDPSTDTIGSDLVIAENLRRTAPRPSLPGMRTRKAASHSISS